MERSSSGRCAIIVLWPSTLPLCQAIEWPRKSRTETP